MSHGQQAADYVVHLSSPNLSRLIHGFILSKHPVTAVFVQCKLHQA